MNGEGQSTATKHAVIRVGFSSPDSWKSSFFQKSTALLLLTVIVVGLNFHLVLFQIYGWSGMMLDYRETTNSWTSAAQQTISGNSPCSVCRQVESAISVSDTALASVSSGDLFFLSWLFVLLTGSQTGVTSPPTSSETIDHRTVTPSFLGTSPEAPPPRSAAA